jgi:hypothetical protein
MVGSKCAEFGYTQWKSLRSQSIECQTTMPSHTSVFRKFIYFLAETKRYWMTPILIVLLLVAGLLILGGTSAAPFIYTLF